jgi:predicted nucleic acid-binding protein
VLDSSVVIKWFTKEEGSQSAVRILDSFNDESLSIIISDLTFHELANALRYKPDFSPNDVKRCVSQLLELELEVRRLDDELLSESISISFDGGVSFYDAVPVGIAKIEKIPCVTADKKTQFLPLSRKAYPVKLLE